MLSTPYHPYWFLGPIQCVVAYFYLYSKATTVCSCPQKPDRAWNNNATPSNTFSVEHKHRDNVCMHVNTQAIDKANVIHFTAFCTNELHSLQLLQWQHFAMLWNSRVTYNKLSWPLSPYYLSTIPTYISHVHIT
jgi:hypothetical protein